MTLYSNFQKWLPALFATWFFCLPAGLVAQVGETSGEFCGFELSPTDRAARFEEIKAYRAARAARTQSRAEGHPQTIYAPVVFTLVQNTQGDGPTIDEAARAISYANEKFAPADIRFFQCSPPRIVVSNTWYERRLCFRDTTGDCEPSRDWEREFDETYAVANVINVFVVRTDGWSWFRGHGNDYVIFSRSHANYDTPWVLAHELGHYFGLSHTFDDFDENATRDPDDPCYNCPTAGDGFCDTPADRHNGSDDWDGCVYFPLYDDCDRLLAPDGNNMMSYSECPPDFRHFSEEQCEHMYDHFLNQHSDIDCGSDCQTGFNLSGIHLSLSRTYRTTGDILSEAWVVAGTQIYYQAEGRILLLPGFQASPGSTGIFRAYMANCIDDDLAAADDRALPETIIPPAGENRASGRAFGSDVSVAPNPFSGSTEIFYALPETGEVSAQVFGITGDVVAQPIVAERQEAGQHRFTFRAGSLPDGLYMLVLTANGKRTTKLLVLTKAGN